MTLVACPDCGLYGTPERIHDYTCQSNHLEREQHVLDGETEGEWLVSSRMIECEANR